MPWSISRTLYKRTLLAFERFLRGFAVVRFSTLLWVFSGTRLAAEIAKLVRIGLMVRLIRELACHLDTFRPERKNSRSFVKEYLVVARKEDKN